MLLREPRPEGCWRCVLLQLVNVVDVDVVDVGVAGSVGRGSRGHWRHPPGVLNGRLLFMFNGDAQEAWWLSEDDKVL